jgi:hypothetical protein
MTIDNRIKKRGIHAKSVLPENLSPNLTMGICGGLRLVEPFEV